MTVGEKRFLKYAQFVKSVIKALDAQMDLPSTVERGKEVAKILNILEIETDRIRYSLGVDYRKDKTIMAQPKDPVEGKEQL